MKPISSIRPLWLFLAWPISLGLVFVFLNIQLFAHSYDLPGAHVAGVAALCILAAAWGALGGLFLNRLFHPPSRLLPKTLVLAPALAVFLWALRDVDWRPVYLAAFCLPIAILAWRPAFIHAVWAVLLAGSIASLLVASESPPLRFQRYARQFQTGCWCCGYRQRAMRELCSFGEKGYETIARTIAGDEGQIGNTSAEIQSDKFYAPLARWFDQTHPDWRRKAE